MSDWLQSAGSGSNFCLGNSTWHHVPLLVLHGGINSFYCSALQDPSTAAKLTTMLLAMADVRAVLVVLASRLAALRAAAALAAAGGADLRAEAEEGLRVFAPLANRLGVWSLKAELEDLCFLVSLCVLRLPESKGHDGVRQVRTRVKYDR